MDILSAKCVRVCRVWMSAYVQHLCVCGRERVRGFLNPSVIILYVCSRREVGSITSRCWRKSRNGLNSLSLALLSLNQHPSQGTVTSYRKSNLSYANVSSNQQPWKTLERTHYIHAGRENQNEAHLQTKKGGKEERQRGKRKQRRV